MQRAVAIAIVLGAAFVAYAVGNGDIRPTPEVAIVTIAAPTGGATGTTTLQNTTSATTYNVLVGSDATCDPAMTFLVSGGNPVSMPAGASRSVTIGCPPRGVAAMRRCLYHATNSANASALADFVGLCEYGSVGTLTPQQASLDFGTVNVGDSAQIQLDVRNDASTTIRHVYVQTTDINGNFEISTPCNPDAMFCDDDLATMVTQGNNLALQIKCTPQTAGAHSASLFVGTDTFQLMSTGVTLQCTGATSTTPVLGANPTTVDVATPVDVTTGSANAIIHLTNAGGGTLVINDVRTVDVDTGAAADWTYNATGGCTGQITTACSLDPGRQVDINLRFDPNAIGRRRATLLISYRDAIDRTKEISLDGIGLGGTLQLATPATSLAFGMVPIGRTSQLDFALANRGNRDAVAQLSVTTGTTPPFSLSPASSTTVTPNADRIVAATCAPTAAGQFATTVTAQGTDAFMSPNVTLSATCEGSTLALYGTPTAAHFGEIRIGSAARRTVQLASTGGELTFSGQPTLEAPDPDVAISALSQGTTPATFDITVAPQAEGQINHVISISDTGGETLKIPLSGRAVKAEYTVAPMVDLGTFCVGQPTTSSNVALLASGTATIGVQVPALALSPSPFQLALVSPATYPSALAAGTAAHVAITPQRQMAVTTLADTLTWSTDVAAAPTATTALTARFLDSGGAIAPPSLDFGKVVVHLYSDNGQRVMIQNCNPTPLQLDPPMLKTPFSIDSPNFPPMLNPNETTTFSLGFHPTQIGVVTETLRITSPQLPDAPLVVTVTGEGVPQGEDMPDAGVVGPGKGHTSFYACSCRTGSPGAALPLALALAWMLRRRRR